VTNQEFKQYVKRLNEIGIFCIYYDKDQDKVIKSGLNKKIVSSNIEAMKDLARDTELTNTERQNIIEEAELQYKITKYIFSRTYSLVISLYDETDKDGCSYGFRWRIVDNMAVMHTENYASSITQAYIDACYWILERNLIDQDLIDIPELRTPEPQK
jgi:hypothetical protein